MFFLLTTLLIDRAILLLANISTSAVFCNFLMYVNKNLISLSSLMPLH